MADKERLDLLPKKRQKVQGLKSGHMERNLKFQIQSQTIKISFWAFGHSAVEVH